MNALTTPAKPATATFNLPMMQSDTFDQMQRVGKMLAMSPLFPEHLRKGNLEQAIANGVLVVNMAMRLNEDPLTVGQNIYFVGGKPSFSTSYMISRVNQSGVFKDPIDWDVTGNGDTLSATATAVLAATGKKVSFTCDMAMAKAENWTKNPKYKSMPALMLRYRSAAALIRLYAPQTMLGMPVQIEVETGNMKDVTPNEFIERAQAAAKAEVVEAEEVTADKADSTPADTADDAIADETTDSKKEEAGATNEVSEGPSDDEQAEIDAKHSRLLETIKSDLTSSGSPDAVLQFYAEQIDKMKSETPKLHEELMAEVKAFEEAAE